MSNPQQLYKNGYVFTGTALGASQVYTGPWIDTNQTGGIYVRAFCFNNLNNNAVSDAFQIQGTNDVDNSHSQIKINGSGVAQVGNGVVFFLDGPITTRYWRLVLTNGIIAQGVTEVSATEFSVMPNLQALGTSVNVVGTPILLAGNVGSVGADGATTGEMIDQGQAPRCLQVALFVATSSGVSGAAVWNAVRTPAIFKTASVPATPAGNTAVWTPAAGKKFRLMGFIITAQGLAATATGVVTVSFQDAAVAMPIAFDVDVPAVAGVVVGVTQISGGRIDLGNGILSSTINNALNCNISAAGAGTLGTYRVNAWGTEE